MQTFLPYPSFTDTMKCLDYRRLGKQRVEAYQILMSLLGKMDGWKHHPATRMWKGYEEALGLYMNASITEWKRRGYNNTMQLFVPLRKIIMPRWLGDERLHRSHRAALLTKDFDYYQNFGWNEKPIMTYFWPTKHGYELRQRRTECLF